MDRRQREYETEQKEDFRDTEFVHRHLAMTYYEFINGFVH